MQIYIVIVMAVLSGGGVLLEGGALSICNPAILAFSSYLVIDMAVLSGGGELVEGGDLSSRYPGQDGWQWG